LLPRARSNAFPRCPNTSRAAAIIIWWCQTGAYITAQTYLLSIYIFPCNKLS
jgi:hypothetical protein